MGRDRPWWAQDRAEVIRRCQRHSVEEAAGTRSLLLQVTSGCSRRQNMQGWRSSPFMDVVNIRYGKEATTPEATDGWYKVGLMTLGTQLRAVPGMIRNASGPSVVPILRCVFLQHSGQEHISNEDAAVNQPHSRGLRQESLGATAAGPARCGYNQLDASERLRRPSDSKRHRDWQGKWPGAYR